MENNKRFWKSIMTENDPSLNQDKMSIYSIILFQESICRENVDAQDLINYKLQWFLNKRFWYTKIYLPVIKTGGQLWSISEF